MRILIFYQKPKVADFLSKGLAESGFDVTVSRDGRTAVRCFDSRSFDIVLLDIILPDMSGNELCLNFKEKHPELPVIMLTAMGALQDKLNGFDAGADDYLVKPFEFKELLARIHAHTKKHSSHGPVSNVIKAGTIELDLDKKMARREGKDILLSAKELALLELLMRNRNKVLSRSEIAAKVWDITFDTGTNVVDVYINMIRKKIDRDFQVRYIQTRIGLGYVFQEE